MKKSGIAWVCTFHLFHTCVKSQWASWAEKQGEGKNCLAGWRKITQKYFLMSCVSWAGGLFEVAGDCRLWDTKFTPQLEWHSPHNSFQVLIHIHILSSLSSLAKTCTHNSENGDEGGKIFVGHLQHYHCKFNLHDKPYTSDQIGKPCPINQGVSNIKFSPSWREQMAKNCGCERWQYCDNWGAYGNGGLATSGNWDTWDNVRDRVQSRRLEKMTERHIIMDYLFVGQD